MCEEGGRSGRGPRRLLTSSILLSPTRPRMQGILRLVLSCASLVQSHVSFVPFLCRLVLVSSRFCYSPSAVFISSQFCLASYLSRLAFVASPFRLVSCFSRSVLCSWSLGLLVAWSLGLLVSDLLVSRSVVSWCPDLLISWSLVGLLVS